MKREFLTKNDTRKIGVEGVWKMGIFWWHNFNLMLWSLVHFILTHKAFKYTYFFQFWKCEITPHYWRNSALSMGWMWKFSTFSKEKRGLTCFERIHFQRNYIYLFLNIFWFTLKQISMLWEELYPLFWQFI